MLISQIFFKLSQPVAVTFSIRSYCSCPPKNFKVAIAGAAGQVGRHLALLLKQCDLVRELALYDIKKTKGLAADLSYLESLTTVKGYEGEKERYDAFKDADVIVISAGKPRSKCKGMAKLEVFKTNAPLLKGLIEAASEASPDALIAISVIGINVAVPFACAVLKQLGTYDPKRVFGVTLLNEIRASTFVGKYKGLDPAEVSVPVFGGNSPDTIVPILSRVCPCMELCPDERKQLICRIQNACEEVTKAKGGHEQATLSSAYASFIFVASLLRGLTGECVQTTAFIESDVTCAKFFANRILLGKKGLEKNLGVNIESLDCESKEMLKKAYQELNKQIMVAEHFAEEIRTKNKDGEKEKTCKRSVKKKKKKSKKDENVDSDEDEK